MATVLCLLAIRSAALAGTTWDGGGGANTSWGLAANWTQDGLPLLNVTEAIYFVSNILAGSVLTLDGTRYINSLTLNATTSFTIAAGTGGTLNLRSGNITRTNTADGTQTINAGMVLGDPTGATAYTGIWDIIGRFGLVVNGNISEAGGSRGIELTGANWVQFGGNNSFSGGLKITGGRAMVSADMNLGAASGAITLNGGTLQFTNSFNTARTFNLAAASNIWVDAGHTIEMTGSLAGNANLNLRSGGTLILSGAGFNGTGAVSVGTDSVLSLRGAASLASGNFSFNNGGTLELGNGDFTRAIGTGVGQVNMGTIGAIGFSAWGANRVVNLGGTGAMLTWGSGSFMSISTDSHLLFGSRTANATVDFRNAINLNGANRTIRVTRGTGVGADGQISGQISGIDVLSALTITSTNGGRLLLTNGNNSYEGGTGINSGALWLGANATSGAGNTVLGTSSNPVTLTNEASLMAAAAITIGRNITLLSGSTATATLGGVTAHASIFTGTIALGSTTTSGRGVTLSAAQNGTVTFSGVIQDPAGLTGAAGVVTKQGAGTVVLSGANTYRGATIVNAGALNLRNSAALGTTAGGTTVNNGGEIQLEGGVAIGAESLTLNGSGATGRGALRNMSGNNSWAGNIVLGSNATIQSVLGQLTLSGTLGNGGNGADFLFDGAGNTLVTGTITNNADVIKNGTGTLTLQGANTYTGGTFVNGGVLRLTGSLNGTAGTALTFGGDGTFSLNAGAGTSQGMGVLTFAGGHGNVQSIYGGSGNTALTFSSLGVRGLGATGNFVVTGGTNGTTNRIVLTGQPAGFLGAAYFFNYDDFAYVDPAGFVRAINYGVDPGTAVSPGGTSLSGSHVKANGHITSQGTQRFETLHINGNLQYTLGANQKVIVNGILKTGNDPSGFAIISGGDYLQPDPNAQMTIGTAREGDNLTVLTPIIANGSNAITKTGAGTLTLSGNNTYTGGTYVSAGTLLVGANERLFNSGGLTVDGGTFGLQNFTETVGSVVLVNGAITGSGAGTLIGSSYDVRNGSASAILAGTAALTKNTEGTVTLTGANTYTGSTTVNSGTLVAAGTAGGALASTSAVTVNAGGNLALGASDQINNAAPITLAGGTLSKGDFSEGTSTSAGAGTLTLAADGSRIDFGTGTTGTLAFAIFNPGTYSLLIDNWTGTPGAIGSESTDRLIFASDPSANLANFLFSGYAAGAMAILLDGGFYEVTPTSLTPVPEMNPAFIASMLCVGVAVVFHRRAVRARQRNEA